jgi:hypothetical protein
MIVPGPNKNKVLRRQTEEQLQNLSHAQKWESFLKKIDVLNILCILHDLTIKSFDQALPSQSERTDLEG